MVICNIYSCFRMLHSDQKSLTKTQIGRSCLASSCKTQWELQLCRQASRMLQLDMELKPHRRSWFGLHLPRFRWPHCIAAVVTLALMIAGILLWVYHPKQVLIRHDVQATAQSWQP